MTTRRCPRTAGLSVLAVIALLGAACGGGGADSPTTPVGTTVAEVEYQSFQLANSARRDDRVEPQLKFEELVTKVARVHSEQMRDRGFFGHNGPDGNLSRRLRAAGVQFSSAGENLAKLVSVPNPADRAHAQFMASPEHRNVILDSGFHLAGVGVARSGDTYWLTQIYIRP
jgi:uncharacterized protein YkwD